MKETKLYALHSCANLQSYAVPGQVGNQNAVAVIFGAWQAKLNHQLTVPSSLQMILAYGRTN